MSRSNDGSWAGTRGRGRLPSCSVDHFVERARRAVLDDAVRKLIAPLLEMLEQLNGKLARLEQQLEEECAKEPVIALLMTAPYVGVVTAAAFVSVLDDAHPFGNSRKVGAYLGLVPSEKSSGDRRRLGSITKKGNSYVRSLLIEVSWSILRHSSDDPLHRWAKALAKRRGNRIAAERLLGDWPAFVGDVARWHRVRPGLDWPADRARPGAPGPRHRLACSRHEARCRQGAPQGAQLPASPSEKPGGDRLEATPSAPRVRTQERSDRQGG